MRAIAQFRITGKCVKASWRADIISLHSGVSEGRSSGRQASQRVHYLSGPRTGLEYSRKIDHISQISIASEEGSCCEAQQKSCHEKLKSEAKCKTLCFKERRSQLNLKKALRLTVCYLPVVARQRLPIKVYQAKYDMYSHC